MVEIEQKLTKIWCYIAKATLTDLAHNQTGIISGEIRKGCNFCRLVIITNIVAKTNITKLHKSCTNMYLHKRKTILTRILKLKSSNNR